MSKTTDTINIADIRARFSRASNQPHVILLCEDTNTSVTRSMAVKIAEKINVPSFVIDNVNNAYNIPYTLQEILAIIKIIEKEELDARNAGVNIVVGTNVDNANVDTTIRLTPEEHIQTRAMWNGTPAERKQKLLEKIEEREAEAEAEEQAKLDALVNAAIAKTKAEEQAKVDGLIKEAIAKAEADAIAKADADLVAKAKAEAELATKTEITNVRTDVFEIKLKARRMTFTQNNKAKIGYFLPSDMDDKNTAVTYYNSDISKSLTLAMDTNLFNKTNWDYVFSVHYKDHRARFTSLFDITKIDAADSVKVTYATISTYRVCICDIKYAAKIVDTVLELSKLDGSAATIKLSLDPAVSITDTIKTAIKNGSLDKWDICK